MSIDQPRQAYMDVGLSTASPTKLLTMLWDRLVLDLQIADQALADGDAEVAHARMLHAQEIVFELRSTLRHDAWEGAGGLASLYTYVEERLIEANIRKDPSIVQECRSLLEPLHGAVHEAALLAAAEASERSGLAVTA